MNSRLHTLAGAALALTVGGSVVALSPSAGATPAAGYTLSSEGEYTLPSYRIVFANSTIRDLSQAYLRDAANEIHSFSNTRIEIGGVGSKTGAKGEIFVRSAVSSDTCGAGHPLNGDSNSAAWDGCGHQRGTPQVNGGELVLRATAFQQKSVNFRGELAAHELGHVLGLNHHNSNYNGVAQLMHSNLASSYSKGGAYKAGDRNGLRHLSRNTSAPAPVAGGDIYGVDRDDNGRTAVHRLDKSSGFKRFGLQTRTAAGSSKDTARHEHRFADFNGDGVTDLYLFDRADSGRIAVHVLDGKTNYQSYLVRALMPLPADVNFRLDAADYDGDGRADVFGIDTNDAGKTSVHVLSASSSFSSFAVQTRSAMSSTDGAVFAHAVGDFDGDGKADVYVFHKQDTGRTAVHVLDASSTFRRFSIQTRTALPALAQSDWTLDAGDFDGDGRAEIYGIDPSDGGSTSAHVLSPTTNFQKFTAQTKTALPATSNPDWAVSVSQ